MTVVKLLRPSYTEPCPQRGTHPETGVPAEAGPYRNTSLIRKRPPLGPYSRHMPRALWWS